MSHVQYPEYGKQIITGMRNFSNGRKGRNVW